MSIVDAERAAEAFVEAIDAAQQLANAGNVGEDFDALLRFARELLDAVDVEMADHDRVQHPPPLFASTQILRRELDRLRGELRGGTVH